MVLLTKSSWHKAVTEQWGIYNEEENTKIEAAFVAGQPSVLVSVGIRAFEIVFTGTDSAKQVDSTLGKSRLVRRRLVTVAEWNDATNKASKTVKGECAVCCEEFAATPTLPIVNLPRCGHFFHRACVQALADQHKSCPLCRGNVDWHVALTSESSPVKWIRETRCHCM